MSEIIVLVSFAVPSPVNWTPRVGSEREEDGYLGGSLWAGISEPDTSLGIVHFKDDVSRAAHFRDRMEASGEKLPEGDLPVGVRYLRIVSTHGRVLEAVPIQSYLSVVRLLAAPGYGESEEAQLEIGLEEVESLDGYSGHLTGVNSSLEDEVWGLVFWSKPPIIAHVEDDYGSSISRYRRVL